MKFKYIFYQKQFIKDGAFDFNNYSVSCITNMIRILNSYRKQKWRSLLKDETFHCHKIKKEIIKAKIECFGKIDINLPIYTIKLTHVERLLFVKIKNLCYPIGYDKYHFLYSQNANINGVNVNSLKHCLYHALRILVGTQNATEIINELIKNQICFSTLKTTQTQIYKILENFNKEFPNKYKKIKKDIEKIIIKYLG